MPLKDGLLPITVTYTHLFCFGGLGTVSIWGKVKALLFPHDNHTPNLPPKIFRWLMKKKPGKPGVVAYSF